MLSPRVNKLKIRLSLIWDLITNKHKHWVHITITHDDLIALVKDETVEHAALLYHGLERYNSMQLIKQMGDSLSFPDLLEEKSRYLAKYDDYVARKSKAE